MTEDFILEIEGTGVIKHLTYNMVVTWESKETEEKLNDNFIDTFKDVKVDDKYQLPIIVLKDGIAEWIQKNLENTVYGRCKSLQGGDAIGGPELLFGSEGDRSLFVLKWL